MNQILGLICATIVTGLAGNIVTGDTAGKRELPISVKCTPISSCNKGDLISPSIADCKRDSLIKTCTPRNKRFASSTVDIPDTRTGVDCLPVGGKQIACGSPGTDTRCVCDDAVDIRRIQFNQCRCQYWPGIDERSNLPSYCTQYDHGGTSGIHYYTCCNNCKDADKTCSGATYQGGGSSDQYCGSCGTNSELGGGRITYRFNCGSCTAQTMCEQICDKKFLGVLANVRGFCPRWSGCFRGCCLKHVQMQTDPQPLVVTIDAHKLTDDFEFCGDFECQDGEDYMNCPVDCCPIADPVYCTVNETLPCNRDCCVFPGCCSLNLTAENSGDSENSGNSGDGTSHDGGAIHMKESFLLVIILAILGCLLL